MLGGKKNVYRENACGFSVSRKQRGEFAERKIYARAQCFWNIFVYTLIWSHVGANVDFLTRSVLHSSFVSHIHTRVFPSFFLPFILRYRGVSFCFSGVFSPSAPGRRHRSAENHRLRKRPTPPPPRTIFRFSFLQRARATGIPKFTGDQGHETRKASWTINNVRLGNAINYT